MDWQTGDETQGGKKKGKLGANTQWGHPHEKNLKNFSRNDPSRGKNMRGIRI